MVKLNTQHIKELLGKKGASQEDFANFLNVKPANISMAFNGKRNISTDYIFDIANYFKVSPYSLVIDNNTSK